MFATIGLLSINTGIDSDAQAFIIASGISGTEATAINTLVKAAKANGWWTLCNAIYPFVGATAASCKWNLKDPRDLDAAFRLTFPNGALIFASTGVTFNGTTQYADSHLVPNTTLSLNSAHLSIYSRIATDNNGGNGLYESGVTQFSIYRYYDPTNTFYVGINQSSQDSATVSTGAGFYLGSRTASNVITGYKDSSAVINSTTVSSSLSTNKIFLGANNAAGVAQEFDYVELAFATIGSGINGTIAALMYTDIQNFQVSLGRSV